MSPSSVIKIPKLKAADQTKVWGYVSIPNGAEQRFVQAKDAEISIAYNQSYFSGVTPFHQLCYSAQLEPWQTMLVESYLENTILI